MVDEQGCEYDLADRRDERANMPPGYACVSELELDRFAVRSAASIAVRTLSVYPEPISVFGCFPSSLRMTRNRAEPPTSSGTSTSSRRPPTSAAKARLGPVRQITCLMLYPVPFGQDA